MLIKHLIQQRLIFFEIYFLNYLKQAYNHNTYELLSVWGILKRKCEYTFDKKKFSNNLFKRITQKMIQ